MLSRFACEWQCHILLKSQADRILARDRLRSQSVIETLADVMVWRLISDHIRSDKDPEFVANELPKWLGIVGQERCTSKRGVLSDMPVSFETDKGNVCPFPTRVLRGLE